MSISSGPRFATLSYSFGSTFVAGRMISTPLDLIGLFDIGQHLDKFNLYFRSSQRQAACLFQMCLFLWERDLWFWESAWCWCLRCNDGELVAKSNGFFCCCGCEAKRVYERAICIAEIDTLRISTRPTRSSKSGSEISMKHQWTTRDAARGSHCKACGVEQNEQNTENICKEAVKSQAECINCGHMAISHNSHGCKSTCDCKGFVERARK